MTDSVYQNEVTKKYDIPLSHLDFGYIKKCADIKELEKIMKTLRSGEVGRYAELELCCENKIKELDPNNRVLRVSMPLGSLPQLEKDERVQIQTDIQNWLTEMKEEEGEPMQDDVEDILNRVTQRTRHERSDVEIVEDVIQYDEPLPPVRQEAYFRSDSQTATRARCNPDGLYPKRIVKPRDYSEWDKLEKEWDKELENDPNQSQSSNSTQPGPTEKGQRMDVSETEIRSLHKLTISDLTKRVASLPETTRKRLALREKEKGNEAFHAGDYDEALAYYKRGLIATPLTAIYNNRALVYLQQKKWSAAARDGAKVLQEEPNNLKALYRTGRANYELHNLDKAEKYLEQLTDLEPENARAQTLLRSVRAERNKRETNRLAGARRMVITEEGDTDSDSSSSSGEEETKQDEKVEVKPTDSVADCGEKVLPKVNETAPTSEEPEKSVPFVKSPEKVEPKVEIDSSRKSDISHVKQPNNEPVILRSSKGKSERQSDARGDVPSSCTTQMDPDFERVKEKGKQLFGKGDVRGAVDAYTRCITAARGDQNHLAIAYRNRGLAYLRLKEHELAVEDFTQALNIEPDNPVALYRRAMGKRALEDYNGSLSDLERAHSQRPGSGSIKLELEQVRELVSQNPKNPVTDELENDETATSSTDDTKEDLSGFELVDTPATNEITPDPTDDPIDVPVTVKKEEIAEWELVPPSKSDEDTKQLISVLEYLEQTPDSQKVITPSYFGVQWISLRTLAGAEKYKRVIQIICDTDPKRLKEVIGIKLDAQMLDDILLAVHWICSTSDPGKSVLDFAHQTLESLTQISRFDCIFFLVDDQTIRAANMILQTLQEATIDLDVVRFNALKQKYTF